MPKDPAEVQDQYKIEGGFLNEYEFDQSKGDMEEGAQQTPEGGSAEDLRGAAEPGLPENVAERIRQVEGRAQEIVERRRAKQRGGGSKSGASKKGGGASKGGASKSAAKGSSKKGRAGGAAKKGGAKGAAKKGGAKKGAAGKGGSRR